MMYVNGLSSVVSLVTLLSTKTFTPAWAFYFSHPRFVFDSAVMSASVVGAQFFIYSQVKDFGALVFAATMNVRQIVSIAASYVTYHNHITGLQIAGLSFVFLALFYKSYVGIEEAKAKREQEEEEDPIGKGAKDSGNYRAAEQA